jgi:hypothetical protein
MSDSIYPQISEQCTAEAIRALLRDIQSRSTSAASQIRVSGTKEELIHYLRESVERQFAKAEEVERLLRDSEEVGKQHILLLSPAPPNLSPVLNNTNIENGEEVARALFGKSWRNQFPRYEYPSHGYVWADFRVDSGGEWLGKAYGREVFRQSQGLVSTEDLGGGVLQEVRQYSLKEVKSVLVAKWRPGPRVLELRIDLSNLQTEKTIDERRQELWTLLGPAFSSTEFFGMQVDGLLNSLIFDREKPENQQRYAISRVELTDPRSGLIRVIPKSSEDLDHDAGRRASLEAMRKAQFQPSLARVEFKNGVPGCPPTMTDPVSVVVEKTSNGPELRILKRITSEIYEYIFDQLRRRVQ